jgi:beta-glucanase (GH16 family)
MRGAWLLLFTILGAIGFSLAQGGWQMIWNDEFDENTLDLSKWDIEVNCWGGGNNEQQCYTSRPQNVFVKDGVLTLAAVRGPYTGTMHYNTSHLRYHMY